MGSHWTCCTPEQHKTERAESQAGADFTGVYKKYEPARKLLGTKATEFDESVRQNLVMVTLEEAIPDAKIQPMPLACTRSQNNKDYVEWACPATILDANTNVSSSANSTTSPKLSSSANSKTPPTADQNFQIWPNTQCVKLELSQIEGKGTVKHAELIYLPKNDKYEVTAKAYVICAGAVLTPGILFNSGFTTRDPGANHTKATDPKQLRFLPQLVRLYYKCLPKAL